MLARPQDPATQRSKFALQRPCLLEPRGDVAQHSGDAHHLAIVVTK